MFKEVIKKIELQSILVLFCTLFFGYLMLRINNSLSTPAGILGSISIAFGILYTFGSFFSNQIKESYKDVISEYKSTITDLRSSSKFISDSYKEAITKGSSEKMIGDYQTSELDNETTYQA